MDTLGQSHQEGWGPGEAFKTKKVVSLGKSDLSCGKSAETNKLKRWFILLQHLIKNWFHF